MSRKTSLALSGLDRLCLITVGTTKFDALIETIDANCDAVLEVLRKRGLCRLHVQIGRGSIFPQRLLDASAKSGFDVKVSDFIEGIDEVIGKCGLVISHAGAGTILEALRAQKPLIVVVNSFLMDNHQLELATHLAEHRHLYSTTVNDMIDALENVDLTCLRPLPMSSAQRFAREFGSAMGFPDTA